MICPNCNLPKFTGAAGYVGPQCTCLFTEMMPAAPRQAPYPALPFPSIPEFKPSPGEKGCQPLLQLTEEDVRRIVREELAKKEQS
jgi:hypothetical protein